MTEIQYRNGSDAARALLGTAMTLAEEACALPFAAYRDEALFGQEMERIYRNEWVAVCAEASLADPGDCLAVEIGGEPVALVRGRDGQLRALSNVCRHRGTLMLGPGADRIDDGRIVCPYHAWSYNDAGAFRGAPYAGGVDIAPDEHCLPSFRVEVWAGAVFVCLSRETPPLAERLAGIDRHLARFSLDEHQAPLYDTPEIWEANWKLIVENGMESYHLFKVHAETLERVSPTRDAYYVEGSAEWTVTGGPVLQLGDATRGTFVDDGDRYGLVSIPPSFVGIVSPEGWGWLAAHPLTPTTTRVFTAALTKQPRESVSKKGFDTPPPESVAAFLEEDRAICERSQLGMAARESSGGRLVPLERVVVDFHHFLGSRLLGATPPPAHVERAP